MKRFAVLFVFFSLLLPVSAYSQFETVWLKVLENTDLVTKVIFSHNSKWLLCYKIPHPNIVILDVATGEIINDTIKYSLSQPIISNDDSHIYSINNNRIVYYNLETGLDESTALPFEKNITCFSVSKDQKYLLGATKDSNIVGFGVWDLKTGELLKYKKLYEEYDHMEIDSTDFAASCDEVIIDCENNKIYAREFSRTRKFLYVHPKDGPVYDSKYSNKLNQYDFNSLDSVGCNFNDSTNYAFHFTLSNDCQKMALQYQYNDISIMIYNLNTMELISKAGISNTAKKFKFTSDDRYLVTATSVGSDLLSVWDVQTGKLLNQEWGTSWETLDVSDNMGYIAGSVSEKLIMKKFQTTTVTENPDGIETLYPNPTNGNVTLSFILPQSSVLTATFTDINGTEIGEFFNGYLVEGENSLQLDISTFASGTYYLTLNASSYSKMFKVIITK